MRIAIAGLFHETHSFCVEHNETIAFGAGRTG